MSGTRSPSRPPSKPAQRWPDVMIGVLTLALLGGFGTLLLGERKPAETAQPQPATTAVIPSSPGTVPEPATVTPAPAQQPVAQESVTSEPAGAKPTTSTPTPAAQSPAQQPAAQQPDTAPTAANGTAPAPENNVPAANTPDTSTQTQTAGTPPAGATAQPATPAADPTLAQTSEIPPAPQPAPVKPITPPVMPKPAQTTTAPANPATPAQPAADQTAQTPAVPATPAVPPRAGGAVATSENRTPLRSDYRISLGSFSTAGTVNTQTAAVSALGYRVHAIDLGDQYVAQIGPFADEASARQALADIQRAYPNALLYRPRAKASENADSSTSPSSTSSGNTSSSTGSTQNAASGSSSDTAAASTDTVRRAAPSGPTYLQVGAFDRVESAQNLVGILRDNGFAPTVNNPPDRKTTVMVGPYSGDALLRAETRLDNAGLDHFRVR